MKRPWNVRRFTKVSVFAGAVLLSGLTLPAPAQTRDWTNVNDNGFISALTVQADGKILVGGSFVALGGQVYNDLARLNGDGTLDATFNPGASNSVYGLMVQQDGRIVVGGSFTNLAGQVRNRIARLNADGTLDAGFNPGANNSVYCLALQSDGKILLGGAFTTLSGQTRNYLGRLNADGSVDAGFNPGVGFPICPFCPPQLPPIVYSVALQPDGKILVAGSFGILGGRSLTNIGRLNVNGTVDTTFHPAAVDRVDCLALQPDGKILVGIVSYMGFLTTSNYLTRLNTNGTLDTAFNRSFNDAVSSVVPQTDGKILVGGQFTAVGGYSRTNIARVNADGTLDTNFDAHISFPLNGPSRLLSDFALSVQADGKILVGANFPTINGQTASYLGRLNNTDPAQQDLSFDGTTVTWLRSGTCPDVWLVRFSASTNGSDWIELGDGFRISGGWQLTGLALPPSATIRARGFLNGGLYNGSSWFAETNIGPPAIDMQPASRTNVGGTVAVFEVLPAGTAPLAFQWVKDGLNMTNGGNISGAFAATLVVSNVAPGDVGAYSVVVTNGFSSVTSMVATLTVLDPHISGQPISRTNNGGTTATFNVQAAGTAPLGYQWAKDGVNLSDGGNVSGSHAATLTLSNVLGGDAGDYSVVVANPSGSLTSTVATLTVLDPFITSQPTNQWISIGQTATFSASAGSTQGPLVYQWRRFGTNLPGATASSLSLSNVQMADAGRLDVLVSSPAGSLTSAPAILGVVDSFGTGLTGPYGYPHLYSLALQTDGKVLVGGNFSSLGGQLRTNLGRLNADGSLDASFTAAADSIVYSVAVQTDGKILVGGNFTNLNGEARNYIGRLNPDGTVDDTFAPDADYNVYALGLQTDGRIVVGGSFQTLAGQARNYIGMLNSDGTLDSGFNPGANDTVSSLAVQSDGRILAAGRFTFLGGQSRNYIGRLNSDGTLDTSFNPGTSGYYCYCLAVQADGKVLAGGSFSTLGGQPRSYIGRLNADGSLDPAFNPGANSLVFSLAVQADGMILAGGDFTTLGGQLCRRLGRLNPDGTPDSAFNPGADTDVYCLVIQPDGAVLAGGNFTTIGGQPCSNIGRLSNTDLPSEDLRLDGATITWLRGGAAPEVLRTSFETSANGTLWVSAGAGARIAGGWQLSGLRLPANTSIRARGFLEGGYGSSSSWLVESILALAQTPPAIISDDASFGLRSNRFGFDVHALSGQVVVIEATTNFAQWIPIRTNVVTGNSLFFFSDPNTGNFPHRYYRARLYQGALPPPTLGSSAGSIGFQAGQFGFNMAGVSGQTVVIEASTNLANWTALSTNTLGYAPLYFRDPASTNYSYRFYRARP